jgi:acetyltransferase
MATTTVSPMPTVEIRPIRPSDGDELQRFYADLSPESRHARFHGCSRGIGEGLAGFFCGPDHEHREGFAAVIHEPHDGSPRIVGHLCLEPTETQDLEMAVAVADAWQRQGIARELLATAIDWSRRHGAPRLRASMLTSNPGIDALLRSTGLPIARSVAGAGVIEASLELGGGLRRAA